jgi:hypothetical protein
MLTNGAQPVPNQNKNIPLALPSTQSKHTQVTRLGEISPFGQFFKALSEFFSRKNSPMIWVKF